MRIIIFYDLPMDTSANKKEYIRFRKFLINEGFIQMQYSVYTKLVINHSVAKLAVNKVNANLPKDGLLSLLLITEKQFSKMQFLVGSVQNDIEDSVERIIIL